ncbi:MAG: hypothetical protein AAGD01_19505 [Acidobacteriota bacterium]
MTKARIETFEGRRLAPTQAPREGHSAIPATRLGIQRVVLGFILGLLGLLPAAAPLLAQDGPIGRDGVELVRDLNTGIAAVGALSAFAPQFSGAEVDGIFYYSARLAEQGKELWRTDGTDAGTRMVADLCLGPCSGEPGEITAFGDVLVFSLLDANFQRHAWILDEQGPRPLPGAQLTDRFGITAPPPFSFTVWQDTLYFLDNENGQDVLMAWDGGDTLAREVLELPLGTRTPIFAAENQIFFYAGAPPGDGRVWLWRSDGTSAGTFPIFDTCDGISCIVTPDSAVLGNNIFFVTSRPGQGFEMWRSDGTTAGTGVVADRCPGNCSGFDFNFFYGVFDEELYFVGRPDSVTHQLFAIGATGSARQITGEAQPFPNLARNFAVHEGRLYFAGYTPDDAAALWSTDGNTMRQEVDPFGGLDISQFPSTVGWVPQYLASTPSGLFFHVAVSNELWRFNNGIGVLMDAPELRARLAPAGDGVYFPADDGITGAELWQATGPSARLVADAVKDPASSNPQDFVAWDEGAVFKALNTSGQNELWYSDGTPGGTQRFASQAPSGGVEIFRHPRILGSPALLWADGSDGRDNGGLWVADGDGDSGGSAQRIRDDLYYAAGFVDLNDGRALFNGASATPGDIGPGFEPWITDGTPSGTFMIANLADDEIPTPLDPTPPISSFPRDFTAFAGGYAFVAETARAIPTDFGFDGEFFGRELHFTDLTTAGTEMVADLCPGSCSSAPQELTVVDNQLFFTLQPEGNTSPRTRELWVLEDATAAEPRRVFALDQLIDGIFFSEPQGLFPRGDKLIFIARVQNRSQHYVISTDGTQEGTRVIDRISPNGDAWFPRGGQVVPVGERLFFVAGRFVDFDVNDGDTDDELWVTDGTPEGTRVVRSIGQGPISARITGLTALDDRRVAFQAERLGSGFEPWISDGTAAGTRPLGDLVDGEGSSLPSGFALNEDEGKLFFSATAPDTGREPWVANLNREPRPCDSAAGLCLLDNRMEVRVRWHDFRSGRTGQGTPIPISGSDRSGFFSFFRPGNLELAVKALDATTVNGNAWVFSSSLTDLEYWVEVEDLETRTIRHYYNSPRDTCGIADDQSLPWILEDPARLPARQEGSELQELTNSPWVSDALAHAGLSERSNSLAAPTLVEANTSPCVDSDTTLCLAGGRYELSLLWNNGNEGGTARVVREGDSAWFWFFQPNNLEAVVKLLDARDVNGRFWFFVSPLTTLEVIIDLRNTATGELAAYRFENRGNSSPCAIIDTSSPFFAAP